MVRNHPFIMHTKFSEKKIFLAYWYTHPRVFQGVRNIFFFQKKFPVYQTGGAIVIFAEMNYVFIRISLE